MKRVPYIIKSKLEVFSQSLVAICRREKLSVWFLVIIATLLAWNFIHFQINVFLLKTEYWSLLILSSIFYLFYYALDVLKSKVDRQLLLIFMMHLVLQHQYNYIHQLNVVLKYVNKLHLMIFSS